LFGREDRPDGLPVRILVGGELLAYAVIDRIELRDGHISHVDYKAPFDLLFSGSGFEYRTVVEVRGFEP
jgi:hypothetical protein